MLGTDPPWNAAEARCCGRGIGVYIHLNRGFLMNDRAKFKGKIKLRLPLKVRRFIHEIKIAARLASSRSKRKQHNSPHSYIHPSIYHDINPNIEPIIEPNTDERGSGGQNIFTRVIRKLGFASHRDNLEKRDSAITQPVPARISGTG